MGGEVDVLNAGIGKAQSCDGKTIGQTLVGADGRHDTKVMNLSDF